MTVKAKKVERAWVKWVIVAVWSNFVASGLIGMAVYFFRHNGQQFVTHQMALSGDSIITLAWWFAASYAAAQIAEQFRFKIVQDETATNGTAN